MLKRLFAAAGFFVGALVLAWSANIPLIPSTPAFNEPSQIVGTLNTFINTLQGQPTAINNNTPAVVSFGTYCTASGATPQTCNGQRGTATFTGVTVAAVSTGNVVINNNLVTAASSCQVTITADNSAAGSFPYPRSVVTGAGTITVAISNAAAATTTGASSFGVAFNCIQ
jgi:hypothetical protein